MPPTPPHVLLVDQTPQLWGGQTVLRQAVDAYRTDGWRVSVLAPAGGDLERAIAEDHGGDVPFQPLDVPAFTAGRKTPADVLRLLLLTRRFRRYRPLLAEADLVHVNGPRLWLPVDRALGRDPRAGLVLHVHLDHSGAEKRLLGSILRRRPRSLALAVSPFVHRRLREHPALAGLPNVDVLENALPKPPPPFRDRFADRPLRTLAIAGRIGAEKGQLVLLDLAPRFPDLEFLVIGAADPVGRPIEERLRREAPANVRLLGRVRDLAATLDREEAQAILVPSTWEEPFGLVAVEAMAASCLTGVRERGGLVDIAEATGADSFDDDEDLARVVGEWAGLDPSALAHRARDQHARTAERFSPGEWREGLRGAAARVRGSTSE